MRAALVATIVLATTLPSQAQVERRDEIDPWEGYNRWMFNFNDGADRMIIKPVARGYDFIMPEVCLLYTSPSPRDVEEARMPSSA